MIIYYVSEIGERLPLSINVSIESIFQISKQRSSLFIEVLLNVSWIDNNLNFKNLKEDWTLNILSLDEMKSIWTPSLRFDNARDPNLQKFLASFGDVDTTGYIRLLENTKSKISPLSELKNYRKHKGTDA